MLSSCCILLISSAVVIIHAQQIGQQPDGVYVPQESTFEMGKAPELHLPENIERAQNMMLMGGGGVPDMELKPRMENKPKQRKNKLVFPSPQQLSPFHTAPKKESAPTNMFAQQDAPVEAPMFVQQPGGPNGPPSLPKKAKKIQFPKPSELKPFHFGANHKMRLQHQFGSQQAQIQSPDVMSVENHPFVDQDAVPLSPMMREMNNFQFVPRQQPEWVSQDAPQPQPDTMMMPPQWAVESPPEPVFDGESAPFPPFRFHRRPPPPPMPMYDQQFDSNYMGDYNSIEDEMYDNGPIYPMRPWESRLPEYRRARWNRHPRRFYW